MYNRPFAVILQGQQPLAGGMLPVQVHKFRQDNSVDCLSQLGPSTDNNHFIPLTWPERFENFLGRSESCQSLHAVLADMSFLTSV